MVVATLALTGWALDSLLVATEFHQVAGAGWIIHLTHLWWGPPGLLIGLWLARRTFARWVHRQAPPPTVEHLTAELPPAPRMLARQIVAAPLQATLLAWFRAYPTTARLPDDLARQLGQPLLAVEAALAALMAAGLVVPICASDLTFYRLTQDAARLQCLAELAAWQETWLAHSSGLSASVGVPLPRDPRPRTER